MQGSKTVRAVPLTAALAALATVAVGAQAATPKPELVSRGAGTGGPGNGASVFPAVSGDGRIVAFRSDATNLHPADTDTHSDIYVRNLVTGDLLLVSRASGPDGAKGDRSSFNPRISADGRWVAFRSNAANLHPDDPDNTQDIFVRDLFSHETILASRASSDEKGNGGSFNPAISGDGRRVAFRSESTNLDPSDLDPVPDVFVRDLPSGETTLVSRATGQGAKGEGTSRFPVISDDGNRIAYRSEAPNLHPDDPDTTEDIFVRDLGTQETMLISRAEGAGPKGDARSTFVTLSADGRFAAFDSLAANLHPDDTDAIADVFVRDLETGEMTLVSRASGKLGSKGRGSSEPSISADGDVVTFHSVDRSLVPEGSDGSLDVYVRDLSTTQTSLLSGPVTAGAPGPSSEPVISGDGKRVVFHSDADDLSDKDDPAVTDVFAVSVPEPPRCLRQRPTDFAVPGTVTRGTTGRDVIVGSEGDDVIKTGKGDDLVCGGPGDDVVTTGRGGDRVRAGSGHDQVRGGRGGDRLAGNAGRDVLRGGGGRDRISGNDGKDRGRGGGGRDRLFGNRGRDELHGGRGRDRLSGGPGRDRLDGARGRDNCRGGSGKDRFKRCARVRR